MWYIKSNEYYAVKILDLRLKKDILIYKLQPDAFLWYFMH